MTDPSPLNSKIAQAWRFITNQKLAEVMPHTNSRMRSRSRDLFDRDYRQGPDNNRMKLSKPNRDARPGAAIDRLRSLCGGRWAANPHALHYPGPFPSLVFPITAPNGHHLLPIFLSLHYRSPCRSYALYRLALPLCSGPLPTCRHT